MVPGKKTKKKQNLRQKNIQKLFYTQLSKMGGLNMVYPSCNIEWPNRCTLPGFVSGGIFSDIIRGQGCKDTCPQSCRLKATENAWQMWHNLV
jgi:hypothetical protein